MWSEPFSFETMIFEELMDASFFKRVPRLGGDNAQLLRVAMLKILQALLRIGGNPDFDRASLPTNGVKRVLACKYRSGFNSSSDLHVVCLAEALGIERARAFRSLALASARGVRSLAVVLSPSLSAVIASTPVIGVGRQLPVDNFHRGDYTLW